MKTFLGIDSGTSGIKAVLVDENGKILATGYQEIDLITPKQMWVEQDPRDWWSACKYAVNEAVRGHKDTVAGIGLSGQMLGAVMMDKNKELLENCLIWLDQRAYAEVDVLRADIGMPKLLDLTHNVPLTGYWGPKLMWIKKNRPDLFERIAHVLFPKDYLRFCMTGDIAVEVSDASGSYLFDIAKRKWSEEMMALCALPTHIFPQRVLESHDVAGVLTEQAAKELGLNAGVPVVAGAGDQPACAIGNGIVEEGMVSATIGTSGVVFAATQKPIKDDLEAVILAYCHAIPETYTFFGCTLGAGGSFKWLRDVVVNGFKAEGEKLNYPQITACAEQARCGSEGLLFLPYLNGERTPHPDPYAKGVFTGLTYRHGMPELCRSVMEGVTFSLRDTIEGLKAKNIALNEIRASGGGAKSDLWLQIQADIFGSTVVTTNVEEAGCVGAAILAAVGTGFFATEKEACEAWIKREKTIEPNAKNVPLYDDLYAIYRDMYDAMKDSYYRQSMFAEKWYD